MISLLLIFLNGLLAGFSGCVFLILPILLKYISSKSSTFKGILKFSFGVFLAQFVLFVSFNLLSSSLNNKIKFFQSILLVFVGFLLILWFYFAQIKKKDFIFFHAKRSENLFFYGFLFGVTLTSCSLGFQISSLVLVSNLQIFYAIIASFIFALGLVFPLLIISLFAKQLNVITQVYQSNQKLLTFISNFMILFLGYYFIYFGASSLHISSLVNTNLFGMLFILYLLVLIYFTILFFKSNKREKIVIGVFIIILLSLFTSYCINNKTCFVCKLSQTECLINVIFFLITTILLFIVYKLGKK